MAAGPARLTELAVGAQTLRLFLDYDGTLADFAPTPQVIQPNVQVIALLEKLVAAPGLLPAVISGRRLVDIEALLPVRHLLLGGTYGLEMRLPDGRLRCDLPLDDIRPLVKQVMARWQELVGGLEGFNLEDKGWTVALHGRYAGVEDVRRVFPIAHREAEVFLSGVFGANFRLVKGERFLEFAPRAANKKAAVEVVLREMTPPDAGVIYVGDDARDEEAFEAVLVAGGSAARVLWVPTETRAQFSFDSPAAVRAWLEGLLEARKKI